MTKYNNIYYFYGNLALTVDKKVRAWKENFINKHGEHAIISLSLEEILPSVLVTEISTPPFLANARLIIIRSGDIRNNEYADIEYWKKAFINISENTFVVFAHINESYIGLLEFLQLSSQKKEFSLKGEEDALELIRSELPSLSYKAQNALYESIGSNPMLLQNELAKFALVVDLRDVDVLHNIDTTPERMVFKSIDALLMGNIEGALKHLALKNYSNPFELFGEVLRAVRKGALYCALLQSGTKASLAASSIGLKDYPAKKYNTLSPRLRQEFISLYKKFVNGDREMKTGRIKVEGEGIEMFIITTYLDYHFSLIQK